MIRLLLFIACLSVSAAACTPRVADMIYTDPEVVPRHRGALPVEQMIGQAVRYPLEARAAGVAGTVVVRFVVEPDGSLSSFEAIESPRVDMAEAAIAALRAGQAQRQAVQDAYGSPGAVCAGIGVYWSHLSWTYRAQRQALPSRAYSRLMSADQYVAATKQSNPDSVVVSGIRSTGFLHLGNYFGAIRNYVRMQDSHRCFFFIADYHALTTHPDPVALRSATLRVTAELLAAGLDPQKAVIFRQSDVPQIPELYFLLSTLAYKGELEKVPTFKDKVRQQPQNVNAGLLTYPVLMAADILVHRASAVPVGKDQEQHLELTRTFAHRFNTRYGAGVFPEPQPFNFGAELVKIPSLDGQGKMSKSESGSSTVYLADSDEVIRKKVMKAVTDAGPEGPNTEFSPPAANLLQLLSLAAGEEATLPFRESWATGGIRYGDLKKTLAEALVGFIAPQRDKAHALLGDEANLLQTLALGGEEARDSAAATMTEVRRLVGL